MWALQRLGEKEKSSMMPLIELVMPTVQLKKKVIVKGKKESVKKTDEEVFTEVVQKFKGKRVPQIPKEISQAWGTSPIFLDFTLLYEAQLTTKLKIDSANRIITEGIGMGLSIIPVLNLNDDAEFRKAIVALSKQFSAGLCLRITSSDLEVSEELNKKLDVFLKDFGLLRKKIDLLVDVKEIKEDGGVYLRFIKASQKIKALSEWRNFIFASGAFPSSLMSCKVDKETLLPRLDWLNWTKYSKSKEIIRNPLFADYAIRNPIFNNATQYYNSTPSIKYTLENDWLIMKGKLRKYEDYLANAKLLVEDTDYFYGSGLCWGDQNIAQKAQYFHKYIADRKMNLIEEGEGAGRNTDWIAWGISHHLTMVIRQISNLS